MKVKRNIINKMYRNSALRKAIAFSLFIKARTRNSIVKNCTINKLHDITGVSANAIKDRLSVLEEIGLIERVGVNNKHLVFKSLHSNTSHRNVVIPNSKFKPNKKSSKNAYAQEIKFIENVLTAILLVEIQRRKNYAKQIIQQRQQPRSKKEYTEAVKVCNHLGYGRNFFDNGISYKYIAKHIGMSIFKSIQIAELAQNLHLIKKIKNCVRKISICYKYVEDMITNYTYSYRNYIFKKYANKYVLI